MRLKPLVQRSRSLEALISSSIGFGLHKHYMSMIGSILALQSRQKDLVRRRNEEGKHKVSNNTGYSTPHSAPGHKPQQLTRERAMTQQSEALIRDL